jgi:hypothetical protein
MKLKNGKLIKIGITAAPKTRQLLDKLCLYEHKKIKPFFEEMLVGYIQQSYNLHKEAIEGIESDIRNIKQKMDSLSLSLDCTTDKEEREMTKSRIETAEKFYGILFTRKTKHLAHAVEYQKMIEDYHRE